MTKFSLLHTISKAMLVLALANGFALFSISAKKAQKQADITMPVEVVALPEGITRDTFKTVNTPKLLVNKKGVMVKDFLTNQINPWKTNIPQGTSKDLNIDNYIPDPDGTIVIGGTLNFSGETAIKPKKKLLVNEINPVKEDEKTGKLVANDANCAFTAFSGGIKIKNSHHFGQIEDFVLSNLEESVGVLRLRFAALSSGSCESAVVKLHYNASGVDYDGCYNVLYTEDFWVSPVGTVFSTLNGGGPNTYSSQPFGGIISADAVRVEDEYDGFFDVYVTIAINGLTDDLPLTGCISYEIIGCHNLLEVECLPIVPDIQV